ncbi:MAG: porin family protein [Vicinamibacterales bacterium]
MTAVAGFLANRVARIIATLTVLLVVCASSSFAQGMRTGVRGGVNFTTTKTTGEDQDGAVDWQLRGVFGGFVTWRAASWIELQPEVLYAMKGAKGEEFGIVAKLLLDYIEVPVLARISRGSANARSWYVVGGPSFGYLLRAKTRADFGSSTEEIDVIDEVERFDVGIVAGGGLEFGRIVVDGRYTHGLSDIDKDTSDDVKVTNRALSVTVGFRF